jgi:hypothetical protein
MQIPSGKARQHVTTPEAGQSSNEKKFIADANEEASTRSAEATSFSNLDDNYARSSIIFEPELEGPGRFGRRASSRSRYLKQASAKGIKGSSTGRKSSQLDKTTTTLL